MTNLSRVWMVTLALILTVGAVMPPRLLSATAPETMLVTLSELDITATARGHQLAAQAADRFTGYGFTTTVEDLRVFRLGSNDLLVTPADAVAEINLVTYKASDGTDRYDVNISTPKERSDVLDVETNGYQGDMGLQVGGWTQVAGRCFERSSDEATSMDMCYKMNKYSDSVRVGENLRDVYALHAWAVTKGGYFGSTPQRVFRSWLSSQKHVDSSPLEWADWSPKSDSSGNCRDYSISFSAGGATVSHSGQVCEQWGVGKQEEAGDLISTWNHPGEGTMDNRENAQGQEVYVPVDGWPRWSFSWRWWKN